MRPSLFRAPSVLLSAALALAPSLAWAAPPPIRANLGQRQATTTEVRWQPITQTETVTEPWQVVGSTTRVDRSQPTPQVMRFQEVRTDHYRQRATTFPLEAKEERKKTTTTQDYELRTYAVRTATAAVVVPVTTEVGEWVTSPVERPVTTPVQVMSTEPRLVSLEVPVYKTVTATYSIPGQPRLTPVPVQKYRQEAQTVTVTKYRTETENTTTTNYVTSSRLYDRDNRDADIGSIRIHGLTSGVTITSPTLGSVYMRFNRRIDGLSYEYTYTVDGVQGTCTIADHAGNNHANVWFDSDLRWFALSKWWEKHFNARTATNLVNTTTTTTTKQVPYEETVTNLVNVPYQATFSIQFETLANSPEERFGKGDAATGTFWKHYHHAGASCPVKGISDADQAAIRQITPVWIRLRPELDAMQKAAVVGPLATRVNALDPDCKKAFTLVAHHTDVMPIFADDATPATIGTRQEEVIDHYDTRQVWSSEPYMVTRQVPVHTVIRWDPLPGGRRAFGHTHDDPAYRCTNQYLMAGQRGSVTHSKTPVFGPLLEKVVTTVLATRSVTVMEPRIATSTSSVLVDTVPGQDISTSLSPWAATGEKRRVGTGTAREATRSEHVAGAKWAQDLMPAAHLDIAPLKAQASSYQSDMSTGNHRQAISGSALRKKIKASEAISSKPRVVQAGGSIVTKPSAENAPKPRNQNGLSILSNHDSDDRRSPGFGQSGKSVFDNGPKKNEDRRPTSGDPAPKASPAPKR